MGRISETLDRILDRKLSIMREPFSARVFGFDLMDTIPIFSIEIFSRNPSSPTFCEFLRRWIRFRTGWKERTVCGIIDLMDNLRKIAQVKVDTQHDFVYTPNESHFYPQGLRKIDIWNYYEAVREEVLQGLAAARIRVVIKSEETIEKEFESREKPIAIKTVEGFELWNTGRTVGFRTVVEAAGSEFWIRVRPGAGVAPEPFKQLVWEFGRLLGEGEGLVGWNLLYDGDGGYYVVLHASTAIDLENFRDTVGGWVQHVIQQEPLLSMKDPEDPHVSWVDITSYSIDSSVPVLWSLNPETGVPVVQVTNETVRSFTPVLIQSQEVPQEPEPAQAPAQEAAVPIFTSMSSKLLQLPICATGSISPHGIAPEGYSRAIQRALEAVLPDLRAMGYQGDVRKVQVDVGKLPPGKKGATDQDGTIFLSPDLFNLGQEKILQDVLFHEFMHVWVREQDPEHKVGDPQHEVTVLQMEKKRLQEQNVPPDQIEKRIFERKVGFWNRLVQFHWFTRLFKTAEAYNDKDMAQYYRGEPGVTPSRDGYSFTTTDTLGDKENTPSLFYKRHPKTQQEAMGLPTSSPAEVSTNTVNSPSGSINLQDFEYDQDDNVLEGTVVWDQGDFKATSKADVLRALEAKVKGSFPDLRKLTVKDFDLNLDDRIAEFEIKNAYQQEKKKAALNEQQPWRRMIPFGGREYEVEVTMVQGKAVARFVQHQEHLKEEEASAIYGLAYRLFDEFNQDPNAIHTHSAEDKEELARRHDLNRDVINLKKQVNEYRQDDAVHAFLVAIEKDLWVKPTQSILTALGKALYSLRQTGKLLTDS